MSNIFPDFKSRDGRWVKCFKLENSTGFTKAGRLWSDVAHRCNPKGAFQNKKPTYKQCVMSDNFKNFQYFAEWCQDQIGYLEEGYHLDKDILFEGNKVYSEDTCVFIPKDLNAFSKRYDKPRIGIPTGVYITKSGKFIAKAGDKALGNVVVGLFNTAKEASDAYILQKEMYAEIWYKRLLSREFYVDPRVIDKMRGWKYTA